ncbi:MAG TPA: AgmX/PglI C-terminal domain-containing protein [Kofleriaceae bacterium]
MRSILIVVVCAFGCGKGKDPRFEGPMPITLGACAGPTVKFVSGPWPLPFTPQEAEGTTATAAAPTKPTAAPPTPESPDESGGTGTAMALDEGKMGAKDARQAAIDEARKAGILGSKAIETTGTASISEDNSGFGPPKRNVGTAVPMVSVGQPTTSAILDKAIIRHFIKRNIQKIQYCYEKQLVSKPSLAGKVNTQFFINPQGIVETSTATGVDPDVASCVADVIHGIEFPKPQGGVGVHVNYPFIFHSAGDSEEPPPGTTALVADAGSAARPADVPAPAPAARAPPPNGNHSHELFRSADADYVDAVHYSPASGNPLESQEPVLEECLRKNPQHYGAVVVELHYDPSGTVTDAKVHGIDDPRTSACLIATAKLVKHAGVTAERCGLAFGDMQLADLPAIDINTNITFGSVHIPTQSVVADEAKLTKIPDLEAAVIKTVQAAMAATVSLHGPIVVRPEDATPMKVVIRVLGSVLAGGDDFVLAHHQGATWEPLYQMTLPIVPVPIGTGGKWNPVKGQARNGHPAIGDDEHVVLSVLVAKDQIWIGVSRINEFQQITHGAGQAEKLVATLKEQKASAFFADRSDIEIAADDDVTYGDVLAVIAKAREVGFIDWQLTDPAGLAARPTL